MARYNPQDQYTVKKCRIPRKVVLPFGYVIRIRQLTNKQMDNMDKDCDGLWDCNLRTIYIRKSLPLTRKRYILTHEVGHAFLDWQHQHLDEGKATT